MLQLRATVAFTANRTMLVEVTAHVVNAEKGTETLTNKYMSRIFFSSFLAATAPAWFRLIVPFVLASHLTDHRFFFTFVCERSDAPVRPVIPQTYEEAMKYLEGKRKWERRLEDDKECIA